MTVSVLGEQNTTVTKGSDEMIALKHTSAPN